MMKFWLIAALALISSSVHAQAQGCASPTTDAQRVTCSNPALMTREEAIQRLESSLALPPDSFEDDREQCFSAGNRTSIDECLVISQSARLDFLQNQRTAATLGGAPKGWEGSEQQARILQYASHQPQNTPVTSNNGEVADRSDLRREEEPAVPTPSQINSESIKAAAPAPVQNSPPAATSPSLPNPTLPADGPSALNQLTSITLLIVLAGSICFSAFVARRANQVYGYKVYLNPYNLLLIPAAFSGFMIMIGLSDHAYILVAFFLLLGSGCTYVVWRRNVSATNSAMGTAILLSQMIVGSLILLVWFIIAGGKGQGTTRRSSR